MEYDELELDTLGEEKTALFVIISDTDATFNFVVSIMYSQLFNLLCDKADDVYNGRLPVHVRMLLDEFANIGQIPQFEKLIATIRSREISASIILQSKSQLKAIYKDNADTIEGNCDTTLFLGGKEKTTLKELAEVLGKETIDLYNTSDTRGTSQSYGLNYQKTGKELMSQDETGREGELIFRLVYEQAGCSKPMKRLWISSMEESAIREGFENLKPGSDYDHLYHSALCRQEADWLVGINGTRLFTVLYGGKVLKVGRVQTPTLAMLVEREAKIMNFKKEQYFMAHILCGGVDAATERIDSKTEAENVAGACLNGQALVTSVVKEEKAVAPPKLYDLTTLQRDANRLFGFTAKQTLEYTQSL